MNITTTLREREASEMITPSDIYHLCAIMQLDRLTVCGIVAWSDRTIREKLDVLSIHAVDMSTGCSANAGFAVTHGKDAIIKRN